MMIEKEEEIRALLERSGLYPGTRSFYTYHHDYHRGRASEKGEELSRGDVAGKLSALRESPELHDAVLTLGAIAYLLQRTPPGSFRHLFSEELRSLIGRMSDRVRERPEIAEKFYLPV